MNDLLVDHDNSYVNGLDKAVPSYKNDRVDIDTRKDQHLSRVV